MNAPSRLPGRLRLEEAQEVLGVVDQHVNTPEAITAVSMTARPGSLYEVGSMIAPMPVAEAG